MARVLIPVPSTDFDPSETGAPWAVLTEAGHEVTFATPDGQVASADPIVLRGVLLGQLGPVPDARRAYDAMIASPASQKPVRWDEVDPDAYDGLLLPGGHAQGMRPFLESSEVQRVTRAFFDQRKPTAAICHGVIVAARTQGEDGRSVLHGRRTTCLPKYMERIAYWITAWKLGRYYRTYPAYVEDEVRAALGDEGTFERGPIHLMAKGTANNDGPSFCVHDGHYVSARWPGDAFRIGHELVRML